MSNAPKDRILSFFNKMDMISVPEKYVKTAMVILESGEVLYTPVDELDEFLKTALNEEDVVESIEAVVDLKKARRDVLDEVDDILSQIF